jgi:hypothetical protein
MTAKFQNNSHGVNQVTRADAAGFCPDFSSDDDVARVIPASTLSPALPVANATDVNALRDVRTDHPQGLTLLLPGGAEPSQAAARCRFSYPVSTGSASISPARAEARSQRLPRLVTRLLCRLTLGTEHGPARDAESGLRRIPPASESHPDDRHALHPDHIGLAGWMRSGSPYAPLIMTRRNGSPRACRCVTRAPGNRPRCTAL